MEGRELPEHGGRREATLHTVGGTLVAILPLCIWARYTSLGTPGPVPTVSPAMLPAACQIKAYRARA